MNGWNPDANYIENNYQNKKNRRRLRHGKFYESILYNFCQILW